MNLRALEHSSIRQSRFVSMLALAIGIGSLGLTQSGLAATEPFKTIHTFQGGTDGADPATKLSIDLTGHVFGTTTAGGEANAGTVFKLARAGDGWHETILYQFTGGGDGKTPASDLTLKDDGAALFGTTTNGGAYGMGTVYRLSRPPVSGGAWAETVLYSFAGGTDGELPEGGITRLGHHEIIGTTSQGGTHHDGTVFLIKQTPAGNWKESQLYSFSGGGNGAVPGDHLTRDDDGGVFGITFGQPSIGQGVVYRLQPHLNTMGIVDETTLSVFPSGGPPFSYPNGSLLHHAGRLYGTMAGGQSTTDQTNGNGMVFVLIPPASPGGTWTRKVIHAFQGGADGTLPIGGVVRSEDGKLYGETIEGGAFGYGTIFKLTPPAIAGGAWTNTTLYAFTGTSDGGAPNGGLASDGDFLFGTTSTGGAGYGTVFRIVK